MMETAWRRSPDNNLTRNGLTVLVTLTVLSCTAPALAQPSVIPRQADPPQLTPSDSGLQFLTLDDLQTMALQSNPTLVQAVAQISGQEGKALQAGLWPNPTLGYVGDQIDQKGTAGEFQGGLLQQRIVTGGKLSLEREKFEARADVARHNLDAQRFRVRNDVESGFYEVLGADVSLALFEDLLNISKDHYQTTMELVNIGKKTLADLQMAGADLQKARLDLFMAQNERVSKLKALEAVVGHPLGSASLRGDLQSELDKPLPDWEPLLATTLKESPQVLAAIDKLRSDEIALRREEAEPIPDLILEAGVGRNYVEDQTVYRAGLRIEIPLFDQNQGAIQQAEADVERQKAEIDRVKLELSRRFAIAYSAYLTKYRKALDYSRVIVPRSLAAYEMQLEMYRQNRIDWEVVLETQQEYVDNRVRLTEHLVDIATA